MNLSVVCLTMSIIICLFFCFNSRRNNTTCRMLPSVFEWAQGRASVINSSFLGDVIETTCKASKRGKVVVRVSTVLSFLAFRERRRLCNQCCQLFTVYVFAYTITLTQQLWTGLEFLGWNFQVWQLYGKRKMPCLFWATLIWTKLMLMILRMYTLDEKDSIVKYFSSSRSYTIRPTAINWFFS